MSNSEGVKFPLSAIETAIRMKNEFFYGMKVYKDGSIDNLKFEDNGNNRTHCNYLKLKKRECAPKIITSSILFDFRAKNCGDFESNFSLGRYFNIFMMMKNRSEVQQLIFFTNVKFCFNEITFQKIDKSVFDFSVIEEKPTKFYKIELNKVFYDALLGSWEKFSSDRINSATNLLATNEDVEEFFEKLVFALNEPLADDQTEVEESENIEDSEDSVASKKLQEKLFDIIKILKERKSVIPSEVRQWFAKEVNPKKMERHFLPYGWKLEPIIIGYENNNTWSLLQFAAKYLPLECVIYLADSEEEINYRDFEGNTVFHYAAEAENPKVLKFLAGKCLSFYQRNQNSRSIVQSAAGFGSFETMKFLIRSNLVDINDKDEDGFTILHYCVHGENSEKIQYLVKKRSNIHEKNYDCISVLHYAAAVGCLDAVKFLVENGASLELADGRGFKVAHYAAHSKTSDNLKYLAEKGASITKVNLMGTSVLHQAAKYGCIESVKLLVKLGANINHKNFIGESILDFAEASKNPEIINFILEEKKKKRASQSRSFHQEPEPEPEPVTLTEVNN